MRCDELVEDKVAVLYGEADATAQRRVEEHASGCRACRDELSAMRGVRRRLAAWKLPETLRPVRRWRRAPALGGWALPAAAALIVTLGGGLALAGAELRYTNGEWSVRLGRDAQPGVEHLLARQEQRHQQELRSLRAELQALRATDAAPAAAAGVRDDPAVAATVQELIRASEGRQLAALRAGLDAMERRRQYDMARIKTGFSYLEGRNGQDMANAMKLVSYVLGASQPGTPGEPAGPR